MLWAISGGAGFLGLHLARRLLADGHQVRTLDLAPLEGKRLDVLHGSLDRWLFGVPGASAASSRAGFERLRAGGVEGSYTLIRGALHGIAFRGRGTLVPFPRARAWANGVAAQLEGFAG